MKGILESIPSPEAEIVYWHTTRTSDGEIQGQGRKALLSLDLPYDVLFRLLVTPAPNLKIQKQVAEFYVDLCLSEFDKVLRYLRTFFTRILETCDLGTPELKLLRAGEASDFDFPRSTASWMMLSEFCKALQPHEGLGLQLKPILARWR